MTVWLSMKVGGVVVVALALLAMTVTGAVGALVSEPSRAIESASPFANALVLVLRVGICAMGIAAFWPYGECSDED